jgi:hypothetical protein
MLGRYELKECCHPRLKENKLNQEKTSWLKSALTQLKGQWFAILVGAVAGVVISALVPFSFNHFLRPAFTSSPPKTRAVILIPAGHDPVLKPTDTVRYSVQNLSRGWKTWLVIFESPDELFPERAGTPVPGEADTFDASGITLGANSGTLLVYETNVVGTAAFHGYIHDQTALGRKGFSQGIRGQFFNGDAIVLAQKGVTKERPQ